MHKIKIYNCNKVHIVDNYKKALAGHPNIFTGLFEETRATLSGKRKLFANTRAWLLGRGTLFADTKAILKGDKPLFANTRTAFGLLNLKASPNKICDDDSHINEPKGQVPHPSI